MGIIQRQSIRSTIGISAGFLIGAFNLLVLAPKFLTTEQLGLTRLITDLGITLATLCRAMRGDGAIVQVRVANPRCQRTADEHLPFTKEKRRQKSDECDPKMRENERGALFSEHSSTSID